MMASILKMKGYVVSGIIIEDGQSHLNQLKFKDIPLITEDVASQQKSGIVIDTLSSNVSDELNKKHNLYHNRS